MAYLFAAHFAWRNLTAWQATLLALPLALGVGLGWLLVLYLNSLIIRALRALGLFRRLADDRAQSLFIGIMTTAFAVLLLRAGFFFSAAAAVWLILLVLNLLAAVVLALLPRDATPAA